MNKLTENAKILVYQQDSSQKCSAWKDSRFKLLKFQFPPEGLKEVNIPNLNLLLFLKKFLVRSGGLIFCVF